MTLTPRLCDNLHSITVINVFITDVNLKSFLLGFFCLVLSSKTPSILNIPSCPEKSLFRPPLKKTNLVFRQTSSKFKFKSDYRKLNNDLVGLNLFQSPVGSSASTPTSNHPYAPLQSPTLTSANSPAPVNNNRYSGKYEASLNKLLPEPNLNKTKAELACWKRQIEHPFRLSV